MVSIARAQSAADTASAPWRPISTTSSPTSTALSPTSSINWSIVTVPATRQRRNPARAKVGEHRVEPAQLLAGVRVVGLAGDGQVCADTGELELRPVHHLRREVDGRFRTAPDAVHTGVDLEVHAQPVSCAAVGD